jgi:predicted lipid-binding transport protein (Tim44 family)
VPTCPQAFLAGDTAALKEWCGEMCYSVLSEQIKQRKAAGLKIESKILELRNCDVRCAPR